MHLLHQSIAHQKQVAMPTMCFANTVQRHRDQTQIAADTVQIQQAFARAKPGIRLLQGQNIRANFGNHRSRARQIPAAVGADAFVDIVGRDRQIAWCAHAWPKVLSAATAAHWQ